MVAENSANVKKHVRPPLRHMLMKSYEKLSGIVWTPSDKWLSALGIGAAQLRSVTEIAPPQPFLYMNSSPIQCDFRGCVKAIQHSLNIALINLHFVEQNANEKQIKRKWQLTVLEVDMHYRKKNCNRVRSLLYVRITFFPLTVVNANILHTLLSLANSKDQ